MNVSAISYGLMETRLQEGAGCACSSCQATASCLDALRQERAERIALANLRLVRKLRGKRPTRGLAVCVNCGHKEIQERRTCLSLCVRCWNQHRAMRRDAISLVNQRVKRGGLPRIRTLICVDCGAPAVHYEHRDYRRPLDVEPVCRPCNWKRGPAAGVVPAATNHAEAA